MPRDGDFKRLVRRRMRKTGEAYTSARAHLAARPRAGGEEAAGEPFDRFTVRARRALAAAHADATAAGGEIGAEHLLAGLLRDEGSMAAKVLELFGVERGAMERALRPAGVPAPAGVRLNGEARRAIEVAVREAAGLGHGFVGTEHLLLGILAEGGSAACRALAGAGADLDGARERVRHSMASRAPEPRADAWKPLPAGDVASLLECAQDERLTGAMRLRRPGGGAATLHFLFGHLFHAVHGDAVGDEAVLDVLAWPQADLNAEFDARSRLPGAGSVRASIRQLIERAKMNLET
jgi:ATP-dependent Clp protease ATP-binding subunit ClpA